MIKLIDTFLVTVNQLLFNVGIITLTLYKGSSVCIEAFDLCIEFLFGCEETLILFGEEVTGVCRDALHAYIFTICFAKEFDRFIMLSAKLLIFTTLLLLTG
jgi:hypothetical protein